MRTPNLAKNLIQAKEVATEFWKSKDWRFKFVAFYVLQFYLKPREIAQFLKIRPSVILKYMQALNKVRKYPKLIRADSLAEVLEFTETRDIETREETLESLLGLENAEY